MKIAYFNYYMRLDSTSQITMGLMDNGQYDIFNKEFYDAGNAKIAVEYLDSAILVTPDRLDIYFGKCSALNKLYNYPAVADSVEKILNRSKINSNKWFWSNNESFESKDWSGEDFFFNGINDYLSLMYNSFDSSQNSIKRIIETEITLYPKNIWGLNHASRYYDLVGNKEKSIELLLKAYKIDPSDFVIIGNLAYAYESIKDNKNALLYYNKLKELNISEATTYADEGISRINKTKK